MNLSMIGFRYVRIVLSILIIMMVMGVVSYFTMPANEDPSIKVRQALVITRNPGLPADKVETLISKPLELAIRKRPEVNKIKSTSLFGQSIIMIELQNQYFELEQIWDDVHDEIEQVNLPEGTSEPHLNDSFGDVAVMTVAFVADDGFSHADKVTLAQDVRDQLYSVKHTDKVSILGVQPERIYIDIENAKLAQFGLSPKQLAGLIANQNIIQSGGSLDIHGSSLTLQPTGNFTSVDDIRNLQLPLPSTTSRAGVAANTATTMVALGDIANVRRGVADPAIQPVYFNGESAIMFAINMQVDANLLKYTPKVEEKIAEINQGFPVGARLEIATKQAAQVEKAVYGVTINVIQTLVIVLVVVMLFLGIRTGLIVGAIVPAVMLVTLTIMNFMGMTLERMSLATLIIALGLLVDNALVFAEDFRQRLERGESRDKALAEGGKSLAIPLLTSSATTILVFLPLMLAVHPAGEYTRSISIVIMIVLLTSWVLAMMVTPTMCYYFMKVKPPINTTNHSDNPDDTANKNAAKFPLSLFQFALFQRLYEKNLRLFLKIRPLYLLGIVVVLVASLKLFTFVPKKFFPDSDRTQVLVYLTQPAETPMQQTEKMLKQTFTEFADKDKFPYIESFAGYGGFGGPRFVLSLTPVNPADNKAFVVLNVDKIEHMDATIDAAREVFRTGFPNVEAKVMRMFLGPSDANVMQVRIYGPDETVLYNAAKQVEDIISSYPNTLDVTNDWENRVTELKINVDQQRAKQLGISSSDIADSLNMYYAGTPVSLFREGDESIPIMLKGIETERHDMSRLYSTQIYSSTRQTSVPLSQVATVEPVNTFSHILRENLTRSIIIEARNSELSAEAFKPIIDKKIQALAKTLPANHHIEYDGAIKQSVEAQIALSAGFPLCLGIIVILMIAQFNSFRRAFMVLMVIPLMMIGATLGLIIMRADFGFMVTLGLYSLAGIIVNNAIILIDRIDTELDNARKRFKTHNRHSWDDEEADEQIDEVDVLVHASVKRLRPIVMTTVTTILGLLPLLLSKDPLFYGMAAVIAFGLGVGAFVTLTFTPVLYAVLFKIHSKNSKGSKRSKGYQKSATS